MTQRYNPQDIYFKKAQKEGYRARSVYKLKEIDEKFRIFKRGQKVLDLGCAPGSWTQYLVEKTGGEVIGVDIQEVEIIQGADTFICDIFSGNLDILFKNKGLSKFDVIVSDMAPKTTGVSDVDQYASVELNIEALQVVNKYLKPNGWAVFKIFRGEDFNDFWSEAKKIFPDMKTFKPKACRDRSFEVYCIGKRK